MRVKRYLSVALRWIVITAAVFTVVVATGLYITNEVVPKVYTASALVELPASELMIPSAGAIPEPVAFQPEFENTMMSPEFLLSVVKDLGLDREWAKRVYKTEQDQVPDVDALTHVEKLVRVDVKQGTNVVEITALSDIPKEAADIANAIADHYKALSAAGRGDVAGPVRGQEVLILSRAEPPSEPSRPNKSFDYIVTLVAAGFLSVMAASFVEIIFLFLRAGERAGN
jgi:capsular polysaccharide biosynthesis protein